MNREDDSIISGEFFNLSNIETETHLDMSVLTLSMLYSSVDITAYDIDYNPCSIFSINDIFDDIEYFDEFNDITYIDESLG